MLVSFVEFFLIVVLVGFSQGVLLDDQQGKDYGFSEFDARSDNRIIF